jgi:anti-sigma-K factor RskA
MVISFRDDLKFPSKTHFEDNADEDAEEEIDGMGEDNNVVEFRPTGFNVYKYAFAACLALLVISLAALFNVYNRLQESNNLVASLQTQNQRFTNEVNLKDQQLAVFHDPSYKLLKLQGTAHSPSSALMVIWSPAKKKVMIDMATAKMPVNDKDHQYQLWALVGGKPVDLGVFDANPDSTDMKEMKSIASAEAFAVTLEPRGGSVNPTMDQMMVISKF